MNDNIAYVLFFFFVLIIVGFVIFLLVEFSKNKNETNEIKDDEVENKIINAYKPTGYKREQLVCETLQEIYGMGFPTIRPKFLTNPETGELLEYDCYCEELKIAAEHNGEQHYIFPNRFHKSIDEFMAQRRRDDNKYRLSNENGVYLISVPYWVPYKDIKEWIIYHLPENVAKRNYIQKLIEKHTNNKA